MKKPIEQYQELQREADAERALGPPSFDKWQWVATAVIVGLFVLAALLTLDMPYGGPPA